MAKPTGRTWNRGRYWGATIVLCGLLIFSGVLIIRNSMSAIQVSDELHVPTYLGVYILPIAEILAAVIILLRKFATLRVFAYAWALYYFALEAILLVNAQDYLLAALSIFKIVVWAVAFRWDRDRIARMNMYSPAIE
jgi:hypothetical protein